MVFLEYIKEVYIRLFFILWGVSLIFLSFFMYREEYFYVLGGTVWDLVPSSFIFTGFGEVFLGYLWMCFIFSFLIGFWLLILNIYFFLLSGLYSIEALLWRRRLSLGTFLIILGFYLLHTYVVSLLCWYLMGYGVLESIGGFSLEFEPRFGEFIGFILRIDFLLFLLLVSFISLFFYLYNKESKLGYLRYGCYFLAFLMIVLFLPPDFFLHILVFFSVVVIVEILFFIICIKKAYRIVFDEYFL